MPLLCTSLLALLLLPLSLSCDEKRPHAQVRRDYMAIVQTDLGNTRGSVEALLQNSSCPEQKHKLRDCRTNSTNIVSILHYLTCKMKNLRLSHTDLLTRRVLNSIHCPCLERPTKESNAMRRRRNEQRGNKRETKQMCKAKAILSAMTECYEMLNDADT